MRKCPVCNSCLHKIIILNSLYLYCDFCNEFYNTDGKKLSEEETNETLKSFETRQEITEEN